MSRKEEEKVLLVHRLEQLSCVCLCVCVWSIINRTLVVTKAPPNGGYCTVVG
jgi:hypothetical protein